MVENWSLRFRMFLFFALIGGLVALAIGGALMLAGGRIGDEATPHLVLFGGLAAFAAIGIALGVWQLFDAHVARPIEKIVGEIRDTVHAGNTPRLSEEQARYLGGLGPVIREATEALADARDAVEARIAEATARAERRRNQLEAVLRDLDQGVLICTLDHRITLYNRRALSILHISGDLGLGRDVRGLVTAQPVRHTLDRLTLRFREGRHIGDPEGLGALLICGACDGRHTLQGRMTLVLDDAETAPVGYVLTFEDVTHTLAAQVGRERLLHRAIEDLRSPLANARAAAETLQTLEAGDANRHAFEAVVVEEIDGLAAKLEALDDEAKASLTSAWPMSDVFSSTLFHCVIQRDSENRRLTVQTLGAPVWLHCDSLTVAELLDRLMNRIADFAETRAFTLTASMLDDRIAVDMLWHGAAPGVAALDGWLAEALDDDLGGLTGAEVVERHNTQIWTQAAGEDEARLRLLLAPPVKRHAAQTQTAVPAIAARPEFYDFDMLAHADPAAIDDRPLGRLAYVVFDTETTGLEPSNGDEIVQIAGVRVVNGRIMQGEVFNQLVHPGRRIPAASTRVHGVTNEMVADAPPICDVLKRFHAFCQGAVLVAHNAAFDMRFLELKEDKCGLRFDHAVLDTVLLAGHLYGVQEALTLDALADRFGIEIPAADRHTALGDSLATAEVLLRFLDMLEPVGVRSLRDAVEASAKLAAIRRQQARY